MIPYALFNSKIGFEPFQYKPFFEFFEHTDKDLYIADEVGVGKTIEAGIIISELIYGDRNNAWIKESLENVNKPRILILAPPALCAQWKEELESKFMLFSYDCYTGSLGQNSKASIMIYAESWQQLAKIEDDTTEYDLLIVDEVHNFRNEFIEDIFSGEKKDSRKYRSLEKIAKRAKRKIFLSATPVFNKSADLKNEIKLLTEEYSITSSTKSVSKCLDFQPRIESVLVNLNELEMQLYNAIAGISSINQITKSAVYLHEGCSSMPCLAKTLTESSESFLNNCIKEYELDEDSYETINHIKSALKEKDYDYLERIRDTVEDISLKLIISGLLGRQVLEEYGTRYLREKDNYNDSKLTMLEKVIAEKLSKENGYIMNKTHVVVFGHYIETCNYISDYFKKNHADYAVFLATGENSKEDIDRQIDDFKASCAEDKKHSVMICSDVCREGKNMQECQVLINYDLPFSPSIMQQRIGRIDRNGQTKTPLIFNLVCNVDNDIHTYYEIIFGKIRIINGINGICGVDVIKETNTEVQKKVIEQWCKKATDDAKNYSNNYTAFQNAYLKYLRRERKVSHNYAISEEIAKVEKYTDEQIVENMKDILFNRPNEELKIIREEEHNIGKKEIAKKLFGLESDEDISLRDEMKKYIKEHLFEFCEKEIMTYDEENDTYCLNISEIKSAFCEHIINRQCFGFFQSLEDIDGKRGTAEMYYDESDVAFITSIYHEVRNASDTNGVTLKSFREKMDLEYEDCFVALDPLCSVLRESIH